jgi:hypothetical protein
MVCLIVATTYSFENRGKKEDRKKGQGEGDEAVEIDLDATLEYDTLEYAEPMDF